VTGLSVLVNEVSIKLIELLKEAAPKTERVAVFVNQTNPGAAPFLADLMSWLRDSASKSGRWRRTRSMSWIARSLR
jgi:hypothetical protein